MTITLYKSKADVSFFLIRRGGGNKNQTIKTYDRHDPTRIKKIHIIFMQGDFKCLYISDAENSNKSIINKKSDLFRCVNSLL